MALGIVLTPYGRNPDGTSPPFAVNYSGVNRHDTLCPREPQFNTRGEQGMYYDTPLGGLGATIARKIERWKINRQRRLMGLGSIPTDAELATVRGYTPVASGWINSVSPKGYVTGPWLPPNGADYSGTPAPIALFGLRGLREDPAVVPPAQTPVDVIAALQEHNDKVFALTLVSTAAVAVSAMIAIFRGLKLIHEGK